MTTPEIYVGFSQIKIRDTFDRCRCAKPVRYSVPLGLLIAGVSIPAGFFKFLPKWLVAFGLLIAVADELGWRMRTTRRLLRTGFV